MVRSDPLAQPKPGRAASLPIVIGLLVVFLWLPVEDTHLGWVLLISIILCSQAAFLVLKRRQAVKELQRWDFLWTALIAGLCVSPLALTLMGLKTGLHGHSASDFSASQVLTVLWLTPVWLVAGSFVGLGIALYTRR